MIIYGVALLAFCFLTGNYIGDILGALLGFLPHQTAGRFQANKDFLHTA